MDVKIFDENYISNLPQPSQDLELLYDEYFGKYLGYYLSISEAHKAYTGLESLYQMSFLSRYYYFVKFYKFYLEKRGENEGIYQMFMQLLEDKPSDTEWESLVGIEEQIDKELSLLGLQPARILLI